MKDPVTRWTGQEVVVEAHGIRYRGILRSVTEDEVLLEAREQWITIPTSAVADIRPADASREEGPPKFVPPEFYQED